LRKLVTDKRQTVFLVDWFLIEINHKLIDIFVEITTNFDIVHSPALLVIMSLRDVTRNGSRMLRWLCCGRQRTQSTCRSLACRASPRRIQSRAISVSGTDSLLRSASHVLA